MPKDAKEPAPVGDQISTLLARATPEDLATIDAAVSAKERELDSLRAVRKLVAVALGVEPAKNAKPGPRKHQASGLPSVTPSPRGVVDERRKRIAAEILKNGPTPGSAIAARLNFPAGSVGHTIDHEWFVATDRGYDLTPRGREAAKAAAVAS